MTRKKSKKKSRIKAYKRKWHRLSREDRIFVMKFLSGVLLGLLILILSLCLLIFHIAHSTDSQNSAKKEASSTKEKTSSETQTTLEIQTLPEEKNTEDSSDADSPKDESSGVDNTSEKTEITSDNPEVQLLARLITAEAGSASKQTQIAVASVVLNRVNSEKYPDTISEVIYQSGQYTPTYNGSINQPPTKESLESALYVYKNGSQIPSNVLYQSKYIQGSGIWAQLDGDYFCYE